jgi:hypothetical protein
MFPLGSLTTEAPQSEGICRTPIASPVILLCSMATSQNSKVKSLTLSLAFIPTKKSCENSRRTPQVSLRDRVLTWIIAIALKDRARQRGVSKRQLVLKTHSTRTLNRAASKQTTWSLSQPPAPRPTRCRTVKTRTTIWSLPVTFTFFDPPERLCALAGR